ncbi:hypothetical protein SAMN04515665_12715 [Blastococcus sp. DSM 46786]|uniref:hypothetical protein n=1 Tax=Blastococcus sp. DSM 46786 TaxID=1798227 RepID=UPI0008C6FBB1|nr:hypothetical protein [Blastococcus sp. DSM 46786]SEM03635.1 hypothetical protein SAMN04515665_12715 [Blastococcus sp. DSM 46786]
MIVIAALLLLLGLGLFVGGLLTGSTALYWACVAACAVAAGVLVVARRQLAARAEEPAGAPAVGTGSTASSARSTAPASSTADGVPASDAGPAATGPDLATGATSVPPVTAPPAAADPPAVDPPAVDPAAVEPPAAEPAAAPTPPASELVAVEPDEPVLPAQPTGPPAGGRTAVGAPPELEDPPVEEVEVTDLLIIVDLTDEVLVVDEHPRYHLPGCVHLRRHEPIPLPLDEARTDGFTPCGVCRPDRQLADRARARRSRGA